MANRLDLLAKKKTVLDCVMGLYSRRSTYTPEISGTGFYLFSGTLICKFLSSAQGYTQFVKTRDDNKRISHTFLETSNF